jgi:hypothetical protein
MCEDQRPRMGAFGRMQKPGYLIVPKWLGIEDHFWLH